MEVIQAVGLAITIYMKRVIAEMLIVCFHVLKKTLDECMLGGWVGKKG